MTAPEVGAHRPQLDAAVGALALQVNRETVLAARAALLAEADRLDDELGTRQWHVRRVGLCGGDPVSPEAARPLMNASRRSRSNCRAYNSELRAAASALTPPPGPMATPTSEIAASFHRS